MTLPYSIIVADVLEGLRLLDDATVQTCVTSPPFWNPRDYGVDGQLGLEKIADCLGWATGSECGECFVCHLVAVFRGVRRVLASDGTAWLNLGDSYASGKGTCFNPGGGTTSLAQGRKAAGAHPLDRGSKATLAASKLKAKDLAMIPARVALALQADGWYIRSDIIWNKPNGLPESVTDRPTCTYEHIFLLAKSPRYKYNADAIKEPVAADTVARYTRGRGTNHKYDDGGPGGQTIARSLDHMSQSTGATMKNKRNVWTVTPATSRENHYASYPPSLIRPCVLAGSDEGDLVLDPFCGTGTTGIVAVQLGRRFQGIEINPEYAAISSRRLGDCMYPLL